MEHENVFLGVLHFYTHETRRQCYGNSPEIGICVWNILCIHATPFADETDVFKAARKTPEMNHWLEHRKLPRTRMPPGWWADDPHISSKEKTEICYLSHSTIHRIIHEELSMKTVYGKWVPHFLTGAHKKREWDVPNRCLQWTARTQTTDWCCHRIWNLYKLLCSINCYVGSGQMLRICTGGRTLPPPTSLLLPCRLAWESQRLRQ